MSAVACSSSGACASLAWCLPGSSSSATLSCFNATRPAEYRVRYPAWSWERDVPAVRAAAADAAARLGHRALGQGQLCIGWADLYYVPARHSDAFRELATIFARRSANAELALPTILHVLAGSLHQPDGMTHHTSRVDLSGAPRRAIAASSRAEPAIFRPQCWGYCCSSTPCPELMLRHPCGHRMQLSEPRMRRAFELLWGL